MGERRKNIVLGLIRLFYLQKRITMDYRRAGATGAQNWGRSGAVLVQLNTGGSGWRSIFS